MGIQPPSDLILDVINAADPAKAQAMATRLRQASASSQVSGYADSFNTEMRQMGLPPEQMSMLGTSSSVTIRNATTISRKNATDTPSDAYRRFEATILSKFVETMLPSKATAVYGSGTAGEVWRSMLAERMSDEIAKAGGIGIADSVAASREAASAKSAGAETGSKS